MWFKIGPQELHIGVEPQSIPKGKQHPAFLVQDVNEWHNHLLEQGVVIQKEIPIPVLTVFLFVIPLITAWNSSSPSN